MCTHRMLESLVLCTSCQLMCTHRMLASLVLCTSCQLMCIHRMLESLVLCTSCQSMYTHGMLESLVLFYVVQAVNVYTWNVNRSCCVQAVNQCVHSTCMYMECWSRSCSQAVNQSVHLEYWNHSCCVQAVNFVTWNVGIARDVYKLSINVKHGMFESLVLCTNCQSKWNVAGAHKSLSLRGTVRGILSTFFCIVVVYIKHNILSTHVQTASENILQALVLCTNRYNQSAFKWNVSDTRHGCVLCAKASRWCQC